MALLVTLLATLPLRAQTVLPMRAVALDAGERIRLDGRLDHPAWQRAPVFDRFVERDPSPGAQPPQPTRVQLLFDAQALYVGITAVDSEPQRIRRPLVRDDQVNRTQDFVVVYVDAIGSRRSAQFFRVNAAGSRGDGIHTAADDSEDFAPDFDWDAAVADHPQGWSAVLRLPFASLRFAEGEQDRWRVMVARRLPRESFHLVLSVPLPREASSFIDRLQPLEGIRLPEKHAFLTLRPSLTLRREHRREADGSRDNHRAVDASLDLKWRPRAELVVDATLNPDFSQVALDVPQLRGNTRFALSLSEKRPFFFESADLLRTPTDAFYTRSFTEPRWGLRATWRGSRVAASAFAVDDRGGALVLLPGPYATDAAQQPGSRTLAARAHSDEGALQLGGMMAARRYDDGRGENTVLGPDVQWAIDDAWRMRAQWLHARTSAQPGADGRLGAASARDGDRVYLRAQRNVALGETVLWFDDVGRHFRHDSGFVAQAGVRKWHAFQGLGWRGVGPFHEFWLNGTVERVTDRDGRVVEEKLFPGLWTTGAHNLEWWAEAHLHHRTRPAAAAAPQAQRFLATGLVFTPAPWFPLLDSTLEAGRRLDAVDGVLRSGLRWTTTARLRPLARLELEPMLSTDWLRGGGRRVHDERVLNLLAVWHLGPRSHLRAIVQDVAIDRGGQPLVRERQSSVTWGWRATAGTVIYVGASDAREGVHPRSRMREAFVKLQLDVDDARAWVSRQLDRRQPKRSSSL